MGRNFCPIMIGLMIGLISRSIFASWNPHLLSGSRGNAKLGDGRPSGSSGAFARKPEPGRKFCHIMIRLMIALISRSIFARWNPHLLSASCSGGSLDAQLDDRRLSGKPEVMAQQQLTVQQPGNPLGLQDPPSFLKKLGGSCGLLPSTVSTTVAVGPASSSS